MLMRLVVLAFKSDWRLKRMCVEARPRLLKRLLIRLYGMYQYESASSIAWNSVFAGQPCFPHGMKSIFISGGARIGANCVIFQQVTIGSNALLESKGYGAPQIGSNCYIGAGAKIIGNVRVDDNVRVGANAVVNKDVPDNSVVLSGEQRTVPASDLLDNRFFSFRREWCYFDNWRWVPLRDTSLIAKLSGKAQ